MLNYLYAYTWFWAWVSVGLLCFAAIWSVIAYIKRKVWLASLNALQDSEDGVEYYVGDWKRKLFTWVALKNL